MSKNMEAPEMEEQKQEKYLNKTVSQGLDSLVGKDGKETDASKELKKKQDSDPTVFGNLFKELPENFKDLSDAQKQEMLPNAMNNCLDRELASAGINETSQDSGSQELLKLKADFMASLQSKKGNPEELLNSYFEFTKTLGEYVGAKKGFQATAEKEGGAKNSEQQAKKETNEFSEKLKKLTQDIADQKKKEKNEKAKNEEAEKKQAPEELASDLDAIFPPPGNEKKK